MPALSVRASEEFAADDGGRIKPASILLHSMWSTGNMHMRWYFTLIFAAVCHMLTFHSDRIRRTPLIFLPLWGRRESLFGNEYVVITYYRENIIQTVLSPVEPSKTVKCNIALLIPSHCRRFCSSMEDRCFPQVCFPKAWETLSFLFPRQKINWMDLSRLTIMYYGCLHPVSMYYFPSCHLWVFALKYILYMVFLDHSFSIVMDFAEL